WLRRGGVKSASTNRSVPLRGDAIADVVIVGGGLTGAVIAWTFANAGFRTVVLEAGAVGHGSTAANSALLMQEPDEDLRALTRRYGPAAANRIWQLGRSMTRNFIRTLRRLRIDCDMKQCDSVYYAADRDAIPTLRAEYERRRRAGFGGRWMPEGAIRTRGNAQLDPYRACLGMLRAARGKGARVFERSAVRRVAQTPDGIRAVTAHGSVTARRVIVATGYATPRFKPLAGRFRMKHTYVVATRPVAPALRRRLGIGDVMLWDTERPYHYARWTPDHRLLLGGGDRPVGSSRGPFRAATRDLRDHFVSLYPLLEDVPMAYAWEGLFAMTPDGLPYVGPHRRYPRHLFALGYGGNGMTFTFLAARLLLDWFRGRRSKDLRLFAFGRLR
ncbi:MAG TPA: FAD-binding oxidoreductase, partial [Vicinamibacterales bacterium]|nr:FAD-binding oxidoreductase [Vicinamibacterales bacterium]